MRAGASATQQTLSAEAASVLKHSLSLARRRGHAQVTPLHVAATLLSTRTSLLRRACLKSQPHQPSHPLQCRALELCFNVALNRLPATPGPLLHAQPSLSNALVAALKRAQAHQRRGCIEQQQQQQQPLIAIKVDLDQLVLSILDDPSVSRVMREAGFSSTAVKNNLEDSTNSVSSVFQCYNPTGGIYSTPNSPPGEPQREVIINPNSVWHSHFLTSYASEQNPNFLFSPPKIKPLITTTQVSDHPLSLKEDVKVVLEVFMRKKRRNTVIVGDSLSMAEGLVAEIMSKVERGDVPDELKSAHFIKFQFSSVPLRFMTKEEVQMNVADLKRKVDSFAGTGHVIIIYTGDLKWTVDNGNGNGNGSDGDSSIREGGGFSSAGKEASTVYSPVDHLIAEMGKLISWYNTSNARVWLMATANYHTYMKCQIKQPPLDVQWNLQAVSVPSGGLGLSLNAPSDHDSRIQDFDKKPFWVKDEQEPLNCCQECRSNYDKEAGFKSIWLKPHTIDPILAKDDLLQLRRKYNSLCQRIHNSKNSSNESYGSKNYGYPCSYPSNWPGKNSTIFPDSETISFAAVQTPSSLPRFRRQQSCHIEFSFSNGSSKCHSMEPNLDSLKSIDDKEVKITLALGNSKCAYDELCEILKDNIPWQYESIPAIVRAVTDHSKGMMNQDKFILIRGSDVVGKQRLAIGIAKAVFGSSELVFIMNMKRNNSTVDHNRGALEKALRRHENLVVVIEDVECADPEFVKFLVESCMNGKVETSQRRDHKAIFVLTMNAAADSRCNKKTEDVDSVIQMKMVVQEEKLVLTMPNPDNKRKVDWGVRSRSKSPRNNEMEEVSFTRQSSLNELDLNIKADEEELMKDAGEVDQEQNAMKLLEMIKNSFVLTMDSDKEGRAREMFLSKFKASFREFEGSRNLGGFDIEEIVLEKVLLGSCLYLNDSFDQWLKEVFQASLRMADTGERRAVRFKVCLGSGQGENHEDGFMGTCLPKRIQLCLTG
ncbi:protein SMAX1-LIKE 4 [Andrographis paniculata]|uniref:protein SMAX1-LIKE 4 n=1 Tax=Andrographis paniculata TaxID=175694 RepID=UPI0021E71841|nr:protein SMAX1-LIKE 4 [Andrographis paniculata]